MCPRVGLLDHMVTLPLAFKEPLNCSSEWLYIPTNRVGAFLFLGWRLIEIKFYDTKRDEILHSVVNEAAVDPRRLLAEWRI